MKSSLAVIARLALVALIVLGGPSVASAQALNLSSWSLTNVACNRGSTGAASQFVNNGVAPYTFAWSNGVTVTNNSSSMITGLTAGPYSVTVTDSTPGTPRTGTRNFTIVQPTAISVTPSQTNVTTYGGNNGSATMSASGGAGGYTYSWSSGQNTAVISNLPAGTYTGTVEDANSCTRSQTYVITQPAGVTSVAVPATGDYQVGATLDFTVNFSEAVTVTGTPGLSLTLNTGSVSAGYVSGSGSSGLVFRYAVQAADRDSDGIAIGALSLNGGSILAGGNPPSLTLNSVGSTAGVRIVAPPAPTIGLSPTSLPNGTSNAAYSQSVSASGGTAPYTFAVTSGALPAGLSLAPNGSLSGTPTTAGTFNFTVTATDSAGSPGPYSGARAYSLTIAAAPVLPAPVPTMGEWAMILFALILAGSAALAIQRRRFTI